MYASFYFVAEKVELENKTFSVTVKSVLQIQFETPYCVAKVASTSANYALRIPRVESKV
jgi:hypothetical protein